MRSAPARTLGPRGFATVMLLACACQCGRPQEEAPAPKPTVVSPDEYARAVRQRLQTGPRVSGALRAEREARLRAEVGGTVSEVNVDLGESVERGQLLARIEARSLQDAVFSAEQDLVFARRQVERARRLVAAGAVAATEFDQAENIAAASRSRLADARARLAQAEDQLDDATVHAPFAGLVSERAVNAGDVVAPGTALFAIIDPSSMRLEAQVPSSALAQLSPGQPVHFEVRGLGAESFTGHIEHLSPSVDPATRQLTIIVSIPNTGGHLVAGLFAQGRVAAQEREALVVPLAAVDETGPTPTVLRVTDGQAEEVAVQLGLIDEPGERAEITAGLAPGDVVLTGGGRSIAPGTPVELAPENGAPPEGSPPANAPEIAPLQAPDGGA